MEVLEKTQRKVVVRQRRREVLRAVVGCLSLAFLFYLLDARHPKSSLYCMRHEVLPDNEFEAAKGLHVEDIDCSLIVRPTRTALDLSFFGEISYSFEIVSARLVRPPSRPPPGKDPCRNQCSPGRPCRCRGGGESNNGGDPGRRRRLSEEGAPSPEIEVVAAEGVEEGGGAGGGENGEVQHTHHSLHMGVNDVATLVLEDNQGRTYDFYTFQDEAVAERMLEKVQSFIREARADGNTSDSNNTNNNGGGGGGGGAAEQAPLELEVLYDDSWLDEMACGLFLVVALVLMTRPYVEVVEFNVDSGAMALDRWNLFHCGVFRYSCALENVNKLEITESDVYMMSAHAFEHLRQTKEFGLRVIFSLPLAGPGAPAAAASTVATLSPVAHPGTSASIPAASAETGVVAAGFDAISGTAGGGGSGGGRATVHAAVGLPPSRGAAVAPPRRRRRWGVFLRRLVCWRGAERRFLGERWWRRPATRGVPSTSAGFMYLDLLFGKKELDDRKLRRPVELINDLLLRFGSDVEVGGGGQKKEGNCCVCFRRRSRVVTFPCMHMATCPQCSEILSACPLCRASISEKHIVFL